MNLRSLFQKTWASGLLFFSILVFKRNNKTIDISESPLKNAIKKEETLE